MAMRTNMQTRLPQSQPCEDHHLYFPINRCSRPPCSSFVEACSKRKAASSSPSTACGEECLPCRPGVDRDSGTTLVRSLVSLRPPRLWRSCSRGAPLLLQARSESGELCLLFQSNLPFTVAGTWDVPHLNGTGALKRPEWCPRASLEG
mmetsp:Transcript_58153/g.170042  ORF Transcript_58153/g.170042 Transcript_58153/m.170042 type:complete len:148 (+) Transcript_58153:261-704(+)